jgi:CBS domain-containing protein/PII-like signaling protein
MIKYSLIEIYTSEDMHWNHKPLYLAIIELVRTQKTTARCIVTRAMEGCYENGEVATSRFEVWSLRMPLKIEILLPETELALIVPALREMVTDGIVTVRETNCISHRSEKHLIPRHLIVRDIMTKDPVTVKPETPISEIISIFVSKGFYSVPVVNDENIPVGIITETDLIKKAKLPIRLGLLAHFEDKINGLLANYEKTTAKEIMSAPVHSISQDEYLTNAVDLLLKYNIKRLLIVTGNGLLSGILTIYDIFQTVSEHAPDSSVLQKYIDLVNVKTVEDLVITNCPKVSPETIIEEIVRIIDASPLQRVAVVDTTGKLLGLIFDHDLLTLFSEHKETIWDHLLSAISFTEIGRIHKEKIRLHHLKVASEIMRRDLVTVESKAPVDCAIRLISEKNIRFLPVIDKDGVFKGVISREALLMANCCM